MKADLHLHTLYSEDGEPGATIENMILSAERKGFDTIAITDHMDPDVKPPSMCSVYDPEAFFREFLPLREKYRGRIKVLAGIELGMQPHLSETLRSLVDGFPYDYILGSLHLVREIDPWERYVFEMYGTMETLHAYFREMYENLLVFDYIDALAHMDYAVRFCGLPDGAVPFSEFEEDIDRILGILIRRGTALEYNSKGDRMSGAVSCFYEELFRRYREMGGERVVTGSDSHSPEGIGESLREGAGKLLSAGFTHYSIYENRRPYTAEISL